MAPLFSQDITVLVKIHAFCYDFLLTANDALRKKSSINLSCKTTIAVDT